MGAGAFGRESKNNKSRLSKFSSRGEAPRGRGPLPHRNCTPVRLGHHRGPRPRAHFQSIKPLGLPSFAFFFPLPPPSLCFTQHTLISPPRYLRLSCHNAKGTLVTDMVHGYGLWEGEVCSSLPRATSEKATCGAAHKQARERFGFNVGVACPMGCPAPRQRGEGKERVRSGSSSSS